MRIPRHIDADSIPRQPKPGPGQHGRPPQLQALPSAVVLPEPQRRRHRTIGLVAVLLVAAGVWAAHSWANRPQVAVLGVSQSQPQPATADATQQDIVTGLFATRVPAVFTVRERQDTPAGVVLGRLVATQTADGSGQLAIMVRTIPDGGMGQTSDIRHRQLYSDRYKRESFEWLPSGAVAYRGTDNYELAVFMPHGNQFASVVLSNTKTSAAYDEWLRAIVQHWRWLP